MIVLKDIGRYAELPERAMQIYQGDVPALTAALDAGWDVEEELVISKHTALSPLDLAIIAGQDKVVKLLVEHGVNLNAPGNPAFLRAVRYGKPDLIRYLVAQGAKLDKLNRTGSGAYSQAYYGNKSHIPLIQELGLDIKRYAGPVLRQAVSDHDRKTLTYLLDQGVDINYNEPDQVYPYQATPLTVAARMGNLAMVQFLVERGADVLLAETDGDRPYTIALANKHTEMAEYLKSLEPASAHQVENRKYELRKYKLPAELTGFLTSDNLRLELKPNDYGIGYIDFFPLTAVTEMKVGKLKLLRLSAEVDNYSILQVVWNPKNRGRIGCYDQEHQEYADLCSYSDFLAQPEVYLIRFMEGELS